MRVFYFVFLFLFSFTFYPSSYIYSEDVVSPVSTEEPKFTLDLKDADIGELFKMLAARSKRKIVATDEVRGRVTIFIDNLTVDEAAEAIASVKGLVYEKEEDTIKIMTWGEYEKIPGKKINKRPVEPAVVVPAVVPVAEPPVAELAVVEPTAAPVIPPEIEAPVENAVIPEDEGEPRFTLDLRDVDINELFKIFSAKSNRTITTTPGVQGRATVLINNLTFDEALDVIISLQGLAYEKIESLVRVMTLAEYEKTFGKKFDDRRKIKTIKLKFAKPSGILTIINSFKSDLGKIILDEPSGTIIVIDTPEAQRDMEMIIKELDQPLGTAVFDINYSKSENIKTYLNDLITPGVGQLIIDDRSSKAIVTDLPQRLEKIKSLMAEFDEASRQVLITGEIVQVVLSDQFQRGIDWEGVFKRNGKAWHSLDLVGKYTVTPALSDYQKLTAGTLTKDNYTAVMDMLNTYGNTRIISRPRLVAVNKEEAKVLIGSKEAYVTSTVSAASGSTVTSESVQFIDVGIKLSVVPTIGSDGFITMRIKPELSDVVDTLETASGNKIPILGTSEAETVVKVKDGTMAMVTGLMKSEKKDDLLGFPGLSKLPLLGNALGTRDKQMIKTELIIFLTPQIISGEMKREM